MLYWGNRYTHYYIPERFGDFVDLIVVVHLYRHNKYKTEQPIAKNAGQLVV